MSLVTTIKADGELRCHLIQITDECLVIIYIRLSLLNTLRKRCVYIKGLERKWKNERKKGNVVRFLVKRLQRVWLLMLMSWKYIFFVCHPTCLYNMPDVDDSSFMYTFFIWCEFFSALCALFPKSCIPFVYFMCTFFLFHVHLFLL